MGCDLSHQRLGRNSQVCGRLVGTCQWPPISGKLRLWPVPTNQLTRSAAPLYFEGTGVRIWFVGMEKQMAELRCSVQSLLDFSLPKIRVGTSRWIAPVFRGNVTPGHVSPYLLHRHRAQAPTRPSSSCKSWDHIETRSCTILQSTFSWATLF